ncbi:hypothetical protein [Caballeronia sp. LjRoot31]|jgi:hypothetical protein|uniref:hypothetical protein n=1 Tax=Caballeronia sp. LjRoot31 TaxID=3342324 RepID=UPI003F4F93B8
MYIKKILKDLNGRAYIAICVLMSCLSFALVAQAFQKNENPYDLRISAPRAVSTQRMRIIENGLRTVPDIDIANHKIFRVVEWHSGSERGTLVAVREGVGRAASCSFFEQVGDAPFAFVTGQPFCGFIDVAVGKAATGLPTIKFGVFIRQSFDSPEDKMDFELLFDSSNNLFCHPDSISEKYKCSISTSNPPAGENDVRGGSEVGFPAVRMLSKFSTSKEALAFKK